MQHARPNRLRRAVVYAALATLLGVVSLTLSQCTMVGDNLTGVQLYKGRPTTCIKQCNDFYALVYDQEQKAHDQQALLCDVEKCAALPHESEAPPDPCLVRPSAGCPVCPADDPACWFHSQEDCINAAQKCQDIESARHAAAKVKIAADKQACQDNCHGQGTGSAG